MPEKVRIIAWLPVIVLGALSLACIVPNYILLWREIRAKAGEKIPSMIPIIGGVFGFFAVKLFIMIKTWPNPGWSWYTLLPPVSPMLHLAGVGRFCRFTPSGEIERYVLNFSKKESRGK